MDIIYIYKQNKKTTTKIGPAIAQMCFLCGRSMWNLVWTICTGKNGFLSRKSYNLLEEMGGFRTYSLTTWSGSRCVCVCVCVCAYIYMYSIYVFQESWLSKHLSTTKNRKIAIVKSRDWLRLNVRIDNNNKNCEKTYPKFLLALNLTGTCV